MRKLTGKSAVTDQTPNLDQGELVYRVDPEREKLVLNVLIGRSVDGTFVQGRSPPLKYSIEGDELKGIQDKISALDDAIWSLLQKNGVVSL